MPSSTQAKTNGRKPKESTLRLRTTRRETSESLLQQQPEGEGREREAEREEAEGEGDRFFQLPRRTSTLESLRIKHRGAYRAFTSFKRAIKKIVVPPPGDKQLVTRDLRQCLAQLRYVGGGPSWPLRGLASYIFWWTFMHRLLTITYSALTTGVALLIISILDIPYLFGARSRFIENYFPLLLSAWYVVPSSAIATSLLSERLAFHTL